MGGSSGRAFPGQCYFGPGSSCFLWSIGWLSSRCWAGAQGLSQARAFCLGDQVGSPDTSGPAAPLCPPGVPASASQLPLAWLALTVSFHLSSSWAIHTDASVTTIPSFHQPPLWVHGLLSFGILYGNCLASLAVRHSLPLFLLATPSLLSASPVKCVVSFRNGIVMTLHYAMGGEGKAEGGEEKRSDG